MCFSQIYLGKTSIHRFFAALFKYFLGVLHTD
jgi:hypothetical protein